jgi:hypothetical protein
VGKTTGDGDGNEKGEGVGSGGETSGAEGEIKPVRIKRNITRRRLITDRNNSGKNLVGNMRGC